MSEEYGGALHARFLSGLALAPERVAARGPGWELTYRQLHERALTWAGALLRAADGDGRGGPGAVAVLADKGPDAYTGVLAGLCAGMTVVPMSTGFPASRIRQMLDAAEVSAVVADAAGRALLAEAVEPGGRTPPVLTAGDGTLRAGAAHALTAPRPVRPEDTAYILFTSGSTGRPKGVRVTHGATDHYFQVLGTRYPFTPDDVFSQTFDLNFDCSLFDLFCAWGAGAAIQQIPAAAYRDLPAFAASAGLTVWFSTPSAVALARRTGGLGEGALSGLRWSFFAGEALTCRDAGDWHRAAPHSHVENLYGPTELTVTVTGHRWSPQDRDAGGLVPIGTVHKGHDWLLLGEDGEPTPDEGELVVTGPQMTPGYLDPADEEGRFLEHDGRRWYRTGDRVRRIRGEVLAYVDRLDAQVQVQGWRVEPAEIDQRLREVTGVQDAVTVAVPAPDGQNVLVAFYTGERLSPSLLVRGLRDHLPERMIPRRFQHVPEFPLNPNRKTDRKALRATAAGLLGTTTA
ncbi:AMP-binding protein [Streptomyces pilosus]|uniref:Amino acid adenylation protein n=1 Tax=Streptomyces pilosus TaxID=28893 RepID=A0A918BG68_9ACTN|nr:AMP-binding protein [Streptomyces pilosus]GGQ66689.1 amino acid adenylation protein [Streptomyces pilosus]